MIPGEELFCNFYLTLLLKHSQRIPKQRHDVAIRIIRVDGLPHDAYPGSLHRLSILSSQKSIAMIPERACTWIEHPPLIISQAFGYQAAVEAHPC